MGFEKGAGQLSSADSRGKFLAFFLLKIFQLFFFSFKSLESLLLKTLRCGRHSFHDGPALTVSLVFAGLKLLCRDAEIEKLDL